MSALFEPITLRDVEVRNQLDAPVAVYTILTLVRRLGS